MTGIIDGTLSPVAMSTKRKRLPQGVPRLEAHLVVVRGRIQASQKVIDLAADTSGP